MLALAEIPINVVPCTRSRATVSGTKLCELFHEDDLVRPMKRLVGLRAEPVLPRVTSQRDEADVPYLTYGSMVAMASEALGLERLLRAGTGYETVTACV